MSGFSPFTGDPLVHAIKSLLVKFTERDWTEVIDKLTKEVAHMRQRSGRSGLTMREDPVKTAVSRLLASERILFEWDKVVILGCSAGGDITLRNILRDVIYPHLPIIIVMHHAPGFKFMSGFELQNGISQMPVVVQPDMAIKSGEIYFVPGEMNIGYHITNTSFRLSPSVVEERFRPVIDKVFAATGARFGRKVAAAILSGMLYDGAEGLKDIFLNHGDVVVQKPETAMFDQMPKKANESVPTARLVSLDEIAAWINALSRINLTVKSLQFPSRA